MDKKKSEKEKLETRREKLESYLMTLPAEKKNHLGPAGVMEQSVRKEINEIDQKLKF
jgi:hypothetical protein